MIPEDTRSRDYIYGRFAYWHGVNKHKVWHRDTATYRLGVEDAREEEALKGEPPYRNTASYWANLNQDGFVIGSIPFPDGTTACIYYATHLGDGFSEHLYVWRRYPSNAHNDGFWLQKK